MDKEKSSLQTDGGAAIDGNLDTDSGDVIGRDDKVGGDKVGGDKVGGDKVGGDKVVIHYYNRSSTLQPDNTSASTSENKKQTFTTLDQLPAALKKADHPIELPYGTVSPTSVFYMNRQADQDCLDYFNLSGAVTVYVQAPRQMGKSSLMQRIAHMTKQTDKFKIAYINCGMFTTEQMHSLDKFLIGFCCMVTDALNIPEAIETYWSSPLRSSLSKCSKYLCEYIVRHFNKPLILAMDEMEKVLDTPFRNDFFGMLRTWHNERASDSNLAKVSLFLSSSTEPQLFIDNPNQSPFNVVQPIVLRNFTLTEVQELNERHGAPLTQIQLMALTELIDGHPSLTRIALYMVATKKYDFVTLQHTASDEDGPFAVHLDTLWQKVIGLSAPRQALVQICRHQTYPADQIYYRLKGAGLVKQVDGKVVMRNQLYQRYFARHLYG